MKPLSPALSVFQLWKRDWAELPQAITSKDPAVQSKWEIRLLYPGFKAVMLHRLAHQMWLSDERFWARAVSEFTRWWTGIEIHPGAELGKRVVIDHGMGVVIGQTAEVADDVLIFQGVTLGGTGKPGTGARRHPKVGQGCILGVGSKVIGAIELGSEVKVGAGSVVLEDVESGRTVVGVPARVVRKKDLENWNYQI